MFNFFNQKPLLETESTQWIYDAFAWALKNFNADFFYDQTVLVIPNNQFFPGRVNSEQGMAQLIFDNVKHYAGISHWPTRVLDQSICTITNVPKIEIEGPLRIADGISNNEISDDNRLLIPYNPQQISNPEGMIATFAHIIAHYMGQMAQTAPPGGDEYWPHSTEILAIYLGFGLMFANSAYTFRGGCGSCYNPQATRDAYLTEQQSVYALALFSVLKGIPLASVIPNLKGHLRSFYKKSVKEISNNIEQLDTLKKVPELLNL